jgi:hypothetical protein
MRCKHLEDLFENLGEHDYDHDDVSPDDIRYNCIAWAAGDNQRRWWPVKLGGYWWPPQLPPDEETQENFIRAFALLGYRVCNNASLEKGIEKVAMYVDTKGIPTHMARQLDSGQFIWWSKCGVDFEDIKHKTLFALEGEYHKDGEPGYGRAIVFLKRRRDGRPFLADRIRGFVSRLLGAG